MRLKYDKNGFALESGWECCHVCLPDGTYIGIDDVYVSVASGLPAHAYLDAPPPHADGNWPSRTVRDEQWQILPDFRGKTAYDIETKAARVIMSLGPLYENETLLKPSHDTDQWDGETWVTDNNAQEAAALVEATATRTALMTEASRQIAVLKDAVELGMATEEEKALYDAWRIYRIELTRLDLTIRPIVWPTEPDKVI